LVDRRGVAVRDETGEPPQSVAVAVNTDLDELRGFILEQLSRELQPTH
jgi:hypothetical protein